MLTASIDMSRYKALWDAFLVDLSTFMAEARDWLRTSSPEEQLVGLCTFIFVLLILTVITPKKQKKDVNASKGRQFTAALVLVLIFAFGAGWTMDTGAGSFSGLFAR